MYYHSGCDVPTQDEMWCDWCGEASDTSICPACQYQSACEASSNAPRRCACGCPASDHTLAADDAGTALWLCIACLHACPGLPRTVQGPDQGPEDAPQGTARPEEHASMPHYRDEPYAAQRAEMEAAQTILRFLARKTSTLPERHRVVLARMVYRLTQIRRELEQVPEHMLAERNREAQP